MNNNNNNIPQSDKNSPAEDMDPINQEGSLPQPTDIQILKPDPDALPPKPENIM